MITCKYCENYRKSEYKKKPIPENKLKRRNKNYEKEEDKETKFCEKQNRFITYQSKRCTKFKPTNFFYCNKNYQFVAMPACLKRYNIVKHNGILKQSYINCEDCTQHTAIKEICDENDIYYFPQIINLKRREKKHYKLPRRNKIKLKRRSK